MAEEEKKNCIGYLCPNKINRHHELCDECAYEGGFLKRAYKRQEDLRLKKEAAAIARERRDEELLKRPMTEEEMDDEVEGVRLIRRAMDDTPRRVQLALISYFRARYDFRSDVREDL